MNDLRTQCELCKSLGFTLPVPIKQACKSSTSVLWTLWMTCERNANCANHCECITIDFHEVSEPCECTCKSMRMIANALIHDNIHFIRKSIHTVRHSFANDSLHSQTIHIVHYILREYLICIFFVGFWKDFSQRLRLFTFMAIHGIFAQIRSQAKKG